MSEPKLSIYDTYMCDAAMDIIFANITALEAENAALKEARRWIPVSERLPEEGQHVLIMWHPKKNVAVAEYGSSLIQWTFTHWMPCPEPPEEVTE